MQKRSLLVAAGLVVTAGVLFLILSGQRPAPAPTDTETATNATPSEAPDPTSRLATELAPEVDRAELSMKAAVESGAAVTGIRGRVLDARTLQPVADVEVLAMRDLPNLERVFDRFRGLFRDGLWQESTTAAVPLASARTAADGTFELLGLPPGRVFVDARSERIYVRTPGSVRLATGEIVEGVELLGSAGGRIRGQVLGADGLPASGATVSVRPGLNAFLGQLTQRRYRWLEAAADAEGRFDLPGVPEGAGYTLSAVSQVGALEEMTGVQVVEGRTTTVSIRQHEGATVAGRVLDDDGAPVPNAQVAMVYLDLSRVLFSADGRDEPVQTDAKGEFRLERVASGRVAFVAAAPDLAPSNIEDLAVVDGGVYDQLELRLQTGQRLSGLVVDDLGRPLPGAAVEVRPTERPNDPDILKMALKIRALRAVTGADGRFDVGGLSGDRWMLEASKTGHVTELRFGIRPEERDVRIELPRGVTVVGKVTTADGAPLTRFRVETRSTPPPPAAPASTATDPAVAADASGRSTDAAEGESRRRRGEFRFGGGDPSRRSGSFQMREGSRMLDQNPEGNWQDVQSADGTFTVKGVPPGNVRVRIRADGFRDPQGQEVTLKSGERSEPLTFVVDAGVVAEGIVVDAANGQPIAQAQITAYRARDAGDAAGRRGGLPFRMSIDPEDFDFLGIAAMDGRRSSMSDSRGRFTIDGLQSGTYRFTARHPDLAKASATEVELVDDAPNPEVRIELGAGGGVEGTVTGAGMQPLPDALVVAFSIAAGAFKSGTTDAQGYYKIDGLVPGQYLVFKSKLEERSFNLAFDLMGNMRLKTVTIREGRLSRMDIQDETADGVRVFGVVRDGQEVVGRAIVSALSNDSDGFLGMGIRAKPTDAQGNYELIGLKPGTYFFQVNRFNRGPEQVNLSVEVPEGVRDLRVDLVIPQSAIRGTVVDTSGAPVEGLVVQAGVVEGGVAEASGLLGILLKNGIAQARTDKDGRFEMRSVAEGVYRLTVSGQQRRGGGGAGSNANRRYGDASLDDIRIDGRTPVEGLVLRVPLAGSLTGIVVDGNGQPLPGAEIHYQSDKRQQKAAGEALADLFGIQAQPARSGPDGRFTIAGVTPGVYRVRADAEGLSPGVADDVVVAEDRAADVRLVVVRGATLRVRVTNVDGSKIPFASLTLLDGKGKPLISRVSALSVFRRLMGDQQTKDDSGWYEVGGVPPDTYTIVVTEPGKPELRITRTITDGETVAWDVDMTAELKNAGR